MRITAVRPLVTCAGVAALLAAVSSAGDERATAEIRLAQASGAPGSASGASRRQSQLFADPTEAGNSVESTGFGGLTRQVFQMLDSMPSDIEANNVTFPGDLREGVSGVRLCNSHEYPVRVASLRNVCPLMSMLDNAAQCESHFGGWARFEPNQCRHIATGGQHEAALAVYYEDDGEWKPVPYDSDATITWEMRAAQAENSAGTMFEPICGYERDFLLKSEPVLNDVVACVDRQQSPIFLNFFVRGKANLRLTVSL